MSISLTKALAPIPEWAAPTAQEFGAQILPSGKPAILRDIAPDWPLVIAAREDARKAMSMLEAGANAGLTRVLRADPAVEGRFHYGKDLRSFNFIRGEGNVAGIMLALREQENSYRPSAIAAQGLDHRSLFPGLRQDAPDAVRS